MTSSSSASVRWRFLAPALALIFAGLVLTGCGRPVTDPAPGWLKVGQADRQGYVVWRDLAGCYWIDGSIGISALKAGDHQWCEPRPSDRTAVRDATAKPSKTGSTR